MSRASVLMSMLAIVAGGWAHGANAVSDQQIREFIVQESLRSYPGSCPCPYNVDRAGRRCGARSAWSRPGGYSPTCYVNEVTDEEVRAYRARMRS